jgi:hypothetical protein
LIAGPARPRFDGAHAPRPVYPREVHPGELDRQEGSKGIFQSITATTTIAGMIGGAWIGNGAVTGFQVSMSSGNITSGVIKIYGMK